MRLLLTGGSGFLGAHTIQPLTRAGFDIHTIGRRPVQGATHHQADLMDPHAVTRITHDVRATHLLHLAWSVEPGRYAHAPQNLDWVAASLHLARAFADAGGHRLVAAGTCAEYAWTRPFLPESALLHPTTLYGVAKDALRRLLHQFAANAGLSFAWPRLFFLYGPGEPPGRLVSDAITALTNNRPFPTTHAQQRRDYMHIADAAEALATLTTTPHQGPINIASGQAPKIQEILETLATLTGNPHQILYNTRPVPPTDPTTIQADTTRLQSLPFTPRFTLHSGLFDTLHHI